MPITIEETETVIRQHSPPQALQKNKLGGLAQKAV